MGRDINKEEHKFIQDKYKYDAYQIIKAYLEDLNEKDTKKLIEILIKKDLNNEKKTKSN